MLRLAERDSEEMRNWETLWAKWERACQAPIWAKWETLRPELAKWQKRCTRDSQWLPIAQLPIGVRAGLGERDPARRWHAFSDSILRGEFSKGGPYDPIGLRLKPSLGATLSALRSPVTGIPRLPEPSSRRAVPTTPADQTDAKQPPFHDAVRLPPNAGYFRTHPRRMLARKLCFRWPRERRIDPPPELIASQEASAVGENNPRPPLPRATKVDVHDAITAVYAATIGEKPPNVKELVPLVKAVLRAKNLTATWAIIQQYAKDPRQAGKRWSQGETRKSKQIRRPDE